MVNIKVQKNYFCKLIVTSECFVGKVEQYTTFSYLSVQQLKLSPRGAVDDTNCCPRPKVEGNSSSGHPQHRGGDNMTVAQKDLK